MRDSLQGPSGKYNDGFDNQHGEYQYQLKDHIGYRFEIFNKLGKGSFGYVLKCYDHKNSKFVALKIIRNKKKLQQQGMIEVKILQHLKDHDPEDTMNVVKIIEHFYFRNHLCIVFEMLSHNMYEHIKENQYEGKNGFDEHTVRVFAVQMLKSLRYLKRFEIIHCDLKPENVVIRKKNKPRIKMIDFGSSCFRKDQIYTYIQSRFYRAPEIILGI